MLSISGMGQDNDDVTSTDVDSIGSTLAINEASAKDIAAAIRPYSGEDQERIGAAYLARGGSANTLELAFAILHDEEIRPRSSKTMWWAAGAIVVLGGSLIAIRRIRRGRKG
jgi:NADH:ubiquinone oxidoreductase subunit H